MAEYVTKEQVIDWIRPYGHFDEPIPFETLVYDLREMKAADVAPVVHCKDCVHRTEMGNCGHPRHHGILPSAYPYDFCSYGARRDGGSDAEPKK